jgi:hypothetical protein
MMLRSMTPDSRLRAELVALLGVVLHELRAQLLDRRCLARLALAAPGSPPRRTWASHSCASDRACSTVSSPYSPSEGLRRSPAFVRYWSMNTLRPAGVILHRKPGTSVSRSSTACAWGCAASTADLVSFDLSHDDSLERPGFQGPDRSQRSEVRSGFGKHRHMLNSPKSLINLLYRAVA